jgi:hypothetical protein
MKFSLVAVAAALVAAALSGSASALSVDEAKAMRSSILDELKNHKIKDREQRLRARDLHVGEDDAATAEGSSGDPADPEAHRGPPKGRAKRDFERDRSARGKQKILSIKLNILDLAEQATEEDLDAMLAIYAEMEALHTGGNAAPREGNKAGEDEPEGEGPRHVAPGRDPRMKEHRRALDEIADKYGGLKRAGRGGRPGADGEFGLGERVFSEEDAKAVKQLRRQMKDAKGPDERKALRDQLQVRASLLPSQK